MEPVTRVLSGQMLLNNSDKNFFINFAEVTFGFRLRVSSMTRQAKSERVRYERKASRSVIVLALQV
jgi:hypothetical protein